MDYQLSIWFMLTLVCVHAKQLVPCYFIFGDSLVDNGNNNKLFSLAKTDYMPYGIDYPSGTTGRFTNGRTAVDFIAEYIGFEDDIPSYAMTSGTAILNGLNYASGAGGIRSETGTVAGGKFSFDEQLQNHGSTVSSISALLGENATNYLNKCLYTVGMGSNDYILNYLVPIFYDSSKKYNPTEYATVLIQQYSQQLKTLYNYGARKVAITGLGLIGCAPAQIAMSRSKTCSKKTNDDVRHFDTMLPTLVDTLNHDLPGARFIFVNVSHLQTTLAPNSGITNKITPCCTVDFAGKCIPHLIPCSDRNTYAFYDAYHPTQKFAQLGAERAYNAITPFDDYPYDISTLLHLNI